MTRALVLGGGGPVGIAWEAGVSVGLSTEGVEIAAADRVYGTSAGAFVGAQLALGIDPSETAGDPATARASALAATESVPMANRMQAFATAFMSTALLDLPPEAVRSELGRVALAADVPTEEEFLQYFAVLDGQSWPDRFSCTAVDTSSGELVVWENTSNVDLWHAVASSCAAPCVYPAVTIHGNRYMDGGMRTSLNADLAKGHDRVLVISATVISLPPGISNPILDAVMERIDQELTTLRSSGAAVEVIEPNQEFLDIDAWGAALMDFERATEAYEAGKRQGIDESRRIRRLWNC